MLFLNIQDKENIYFLTAGEIVCFSLLFVCNYLGITGVKNKVLTIDQLQYYSNLLNWQLLQKQQVSFNILLRSTASVISFEILKLNWLFLEGKQQPCFSSSFTIFSTNSQLSFASIYPNTYNNSENPEDLVLADILQYENMN